MLYQTHFYLLALAAGALALPGGTTSRPSKIDANMNLRFKGSTCNDQQKAIVQQGFVDAVTLVENVLGTLNKNSLAYKTFFDPTDTASKTIGKPMFDVVHNVFSQIKTALTDKTDPLSFSCDPNGPACLKSPGNIVAQAIDEDRRVNLCPLFFNEYNDKKKAWSLNQLQCQAKGSVLDRKTKVAMQPQQMEALGTLGAVTIVHELAHLMDPKVADVQSIVDCYYRPYACEYMAIQNPKAAVANADNYANLAAAQYFSTLCRSTTLYYRSWSDNNSFKPKLADYQATGRKALMTLNADIKKRLQGIEGSKPGLLEDGYAFDSDGYIHKPGATPEDQKEIDGFNASMKVLKAKKRQLDTQVNICDKVSDATWAQVEAVMNKRQGK